MYETTTFDTNPYFAGGAGMFIQYHDVIKPVYLYAVIKMILTNRTYGLPMNIIQEFSIPSILEWYRNRKHINPLKQFDYNNKIPLEILDNVLQKELQNDPTIYRITPTLNIDRLLSVYRQQHMNFPIYVYTEKEEPGAKKDCDYIFQGTNYKYVYGNLQESIKECKQNFTYIFSDIDAVKEVSNQLMGTCSHILLVEDYRYNYKPHTKEFKYDLTQLMLDHPFTRIGLTQAMDNNSISTAFSNIMK